MKVIKGILIGILVFVLVIVLLVAILVGALACELSNVQSDFETNQAMMEKTDEELIGTHMYIEREGEKAIDLNIYTCEDDELHPLVINLHGGAFFAGDSDTLDTQSDRISKDWNAVVATVNYTLTNDQYDIAYGSQEVVDTVKYFIANAQDYGIDPERIILMGYSAGGYHAMNAALLLHEEGIEIYKQVLCYAFLGDIMEKYNAMSEEQRSSMPPALFIICGGDPISEGSLEYETALRSNGVATEVKVYETAMHGFLEENNPEYAELSSHASMSPEQEILAREAEKFIGEWIN